MPRSKKRIKNGKPVKYNPMSQISQTNSGGNRKINIQQSTIVEQSSFRISKLPSAEEMEHYQQIDASFPNRFMLRLESEGDHRRAIEKRSLGAAIGLDYLGLIFGFIIMLAILATGIYFMTNNYATAGAAIITSVGVGATTIFIVRSKKQNK